MEEIKRATMEEKKFKENSIEDFTKKFPYAFNDEKYLLNERKSKWSAHERWQEALNKTEFKRLFENKEYLEIVTRALDVVKNSELVPDNDLIKLNNAIRNEGGAKTFAKALYQLIFGTALFSERFDIWCSSFSELPGVMGIEALPKNGTALSWPIATVFMFLVRPDTHALLIPEGVEVYAHNFGFEMSLSDKPSWKQYEQYLEFCEIIKKDLEMLKPKDLIDVQSFITLQ